MLVMGSKWRPRPPPPEPRMPPGLIELMEGLTRDVLRKNPPNVLDFCTRHMQKLLEIRDGRAPKIPLTLEEKIQRAQEKVRQKAEERRLKYDEAIKKHSENGDKDLDDSLNKPVTVSEPVQEPVRVPTPIHQDLGHDKEVEISHEPSKELQKSIEEVDKAMTVDTAKSMKLNSENKAEDESNSQGTQNQFEDNPTVTSVTEENIKALEIRNPDDLNESSLPTSSNLERKPLSLNDKEVHSIENEEETNLETAQIKENRIVSIEKVVSDEETLMKGKSSESDASFIDLLNGNTDDESKNSANSLQETLDIKESGNDGIKGLTEENIHQTNHIHIADENDAVGSSPYVEDSNNEQLFLNHKSNESIPNIHEREMSDTEELNSGVKLEEKNCGDQSKDARTESTDKNYELDEQHNLNIENIDKVDSTNAMKQPSPDEIVKQNVQDVDGNTPEIERVTQLLENLTVEPDKLIQDDINFGNVLDNASKNESLSRNESNAEDSTINQQIKAEDVPVKVESITKSHITDLEHVNNARNLQKFETGENFTSPDFLNKDELTNISKDTLTNPEIELELPDTSDNHHDIVSEPKCAQKFVSTLGVPENNVLNDGDIMHKTEDTDYIITFNSKNNINHNSPENYSFIQVTVQQKSEPEKCTVENKINDANETIVGLVEINGSKEFNGETEIIDLHIVEKPCSENNSRIEANIDILDEDNSESDFILKHSELDEIINQFDSSNVESVPKESTSIQMLAENDDNLVDDEKKIDESLQSNSTPNTNLETAAVTIQKHFRMFLFKSRCSTFEDSLNDDQNSIEEDTENKQVEYQIVPGLNKERRGLCRMESVLQTVNEEKSLSLSTDDSVSSAATIIQARVRGYLVRKRLDSSRTGSTTDNRSISSDEQKEKKILKIHIVPEGEDFMNRDESILESIDLSLDGSPPTSGNRHPLGYDKSEPRKQLKREDAIQSVSPPTSNNGEKTRDEVDSIKDATKPTDQIEQQKDDSITESTPDAGSCETTPSKSTTTVETVIEIHNEDKVIHTPEIDEINQVDSDRISLDESELITPLDDKSFSDSDGTSKLLHSGEFHDILLPSPTQISRSNTTVVREFKTVLGLFLLWK